MRDRIRIDRVGGNRRCEKQGRVYEDRLKQARSHDRRRTLRHDVPRGRQPLHQGQTGLTPALPAFCIADCAIEAWAPPPRHAIYFEVIVFEGYPRPVNRPLTMNAANSAYGEPRVGSEWLA